MTAMPLQWLDATPARPVAWPGHGWILGPTPDGSAVMVLMRMIYNDRLGLQYDGGQTYGAYWCYPHGEAAAAAARWLEDGGPEPSGWLKTWDGRRGGAVSRETGA